MKNLIAMRGSEPPKSTKGKKSIKVLCKVGDYYAMGYYIAEAKQWLVHGECNILVPCKRKHVTWYKEVDG